MDRRKLNGLITCPVCGCTEFDVEFIRNAVETKEKSEVKKKGLATRTANNIGRAGMIAMTGGLWALLRRNQSMWKQAALKPNTRHQKYMFVKNVAIRGRIEELNSAT